jgi:class 3 adenylate cyclase/ActR/RegA family two-component response regulator
VDADRTLTMLFTDLVSSTEIFASLRVCQSQRVQRSHLAMLRRTVEAHRGWLVKSLGDGVMAAFESASAALDCAMAMQIASSRSAEGDPSTELRVGLSSGDVHVDDGDCFGPVVVEASRLCQHAHGGQVLVSHSTRLLVRSAPELSMIGERTLRGLPQSTLVWEADWSIVDSRPRRIILVDDSSLVREGVARVLHERGFDVVGQAGDGELAVELARRCRPDVAILDLRMPPTFTLEGIHVAAHLRRQQPSIGVLVLSHDLHPRVAESLRRLTGSGGVGCLQKDRVADLDEFSAAVRTIASGGTVFNHS